MQDEELTEEERARLRGLIAFQKLVLGIALRWWWLFAAVFLALLTLFSAFLWMRGARSVNRYEAKTRLMYSPKKVSRIDNLGDKQMMTILERGSLKRRVLDYVDMDMMERMCLTVDMKIEQGRRQSNLFTLTAASKTKKGAYAKVNAYADILIDEYVSYRSKDLETWRDSLEVRRKNLMGQISDIDAEEAAFKTTTGALSPKESLLALNALISDQRKNDSALGVEAANEELKKHKLEDIVGDVGATVLANAATIRKKAAAIASIDAELVQLREKYTDLNPKVAGKLQERNEKVLEFEDFLKSKGVEGVELDKIDQIEKAAGEFADCVTRLEVVEQKRAALAKEIADNEKRASELAKIVMDYERIEVRRADLTAAVRDVDDQLSGISYAIGALRNDLRQIERSNGADDNGPFGSKKAIFAFGGAFVVAGGMLFVIIVLELLFGKVRDGREIAIYDGISYLGSIPKSGSMPEDEAREAMGVVSLKTLLAVKDAKTIFACRLPGAEPNMTFAETMDFTATMSGASSFLLDIVAQPNFTPPEGAEEMIGVVRNGQRGWFPAVNRFALAPTELQMLKADIASLVESFDNIFIRIEGVVRVGGTFFDQLLELSDAVLLMVGAGTTPRSSFAFARRHLKPSGKLVMAIAAGSDAKRVRKDMEVLT
jgi:uncharacterized protein involved in exopolysaccharide biosynthesis